MEKQKIVELLQNCEVNKGESLICLMYQKNSNVCDFSIFCKEIINQIDTANIILNIENFTQMLKDSYFEKCNSIKTDLNKRI